jgi:hypothetical protein
MLMQMQAYKGYFINGSALIVHPFSPAWYVGSSVLVPGRGSSIVEVIRFQLQHFTVSINELAEWFGLELARLVVDECLAPDRTEWHNTSTAPAPSVTAIWESWTVPKMWVSAGVGVCL